jgi:hypothetical protein
MIFTIGIISTNLLTNTSFGIESNSSSQKITNTSITIPALCNDQKCLPQLYVSIPINQTLIKNMSGNDLANFKDSHLKVIGNYFDDVFNLAKISSLNANRDKCPKVFDPNILCDGIRIPPKNETTSR